VHRSNIENVAQFKYLGTRETNQNLIQEEIKTRLLPFSPEHGVENIWIEERLSDRRLETTE
jgi:hypothetical protein